MKTTPRSNPIAPRHLRVQTQVRAGVKKDVDGYQCQKCHARCNAQSGTRKELCHFDCANTNPYCRY